MKKLLRQEQECEQVILGSIWSFTVVSVSTVLELFPWVGSLSAETEADLRLLSTSATVLSCGSLYFISHLLSVFQKSLKISDPLTSILCFAVILRIFRVEWSRMVGWGGEDIMSCVFGTLTKYIILYRRNSFSLPVNVILFPWNFTFYFTNVYQIIFIVGILF